MKGKQKPAAKKPAAPTSKQPMAAAEEVPTYRTDMGESLPAQQPPGSGSD